MRGLKCSTRPIASSTWASSAQSMPSSSTCRKTVRRCCSRRHKPAQSRRWLACLSRFVPRMARVLRRADTLVQEPEYVSVHEMAKFATPSKLIQHVLTVRHPLMHTSTLDGMAAHRRMTSIARSSVVRAAREARHHLVLHQGAPQVQVYLLLLVVQASATRLRGLLSPAAWRGRVPPPRQAAADAAPGHVQDLLRAQPRYATSLPAESFAFRSCAHRASRCWNKPCCSPPILRREVSTFRLSTG